jgi:hypothetical protein
MASRPSGVKTALADELGDLRRLVADISDAEMVNATECQGWRVADLFERGANPDPRAGGTML